MTQHYRYSGPSIKGEGWFIAFLDEAGCFSVLSDWGDYSYRWNMRGWNKGIRESLLGCNEDYILSKIAKRDWLDAERTVKELKRMVLQARRDKKLDAEEALAEWDLIAYYDNGSHFDAHGYMASTDLPEAYERFIYDYPAQAREFMKRVWPRLHAAMNADICRTLSKTFEEQLAEKDKEIFRLQGELVATNKKRAHLFEEWHAQVQRAVAAEEALENAVQCTNRPGSRVT